VTAGNYIIREEPKTGWTQVSPAATTIPGATWTNTRWDVTVNALNVQNVDFGNSNPANLAGDYNRDQVVDGSDYILWRRTTGLHVANFSGADGDGNGIVDQAD